MNKSKLREIKNQIKYCCHDGMGASVYSDGTVLQSISINDCIAVSSDNGWDYRIAYITDPNITLKQLRNLFNSL